MMIWVTIQNSPNSITADFKEKILVDWLCHPRRHVSQRKDFRDDGLGETESRKSDLLQWYYASCFSLICENITSTCQDEGLAQRLSEQLTHMGSLKSDAEITVKRWRKGQNELYSTADEEVDRLILFGDEELGLQGDPTAAKLAENRAIQARSRISNRNNTQTFYPGKTLATLGRPSTNAPWELTCLNHHSLLRTALNDGSISKIDKAVRNPCFQFMLADYTFMTSWDRGSKDMLGQWWDFEPVSVICATIIDLKMKGSFSSYTQIIQP